MVLWQNPAIEENKKGQEPYEERKEEFFRPLSPIVLVTYLFFMFILAYFGDNTDTYYNIATGHLSVIILVLILAILVLPDNTFTRPHPAFWRLGLGLNLVYLMVFLYILFQNHKTVKSIIYWGFPELESVTDVFQKPYDINCTDYTLKNVFSKTDVYTLGHFVGWILKAMLIRHYGMCWLLSITWEVTELAFANLLPFSECWWDSIVLDVLLTNGKQNMIKIVQSINFTIGLGIYVGMLILKLFKLETYEWESIKEEQTAHLETREALLKFSAEARDVVESFDHLNTYVRVLGFSLFNILWQMTELNTFFQMQIFDIPAKHPLIVGRFALIAIFVAPLIPEYITYMKEDKITNLSPRCWLFFTIVFVEVSVNIKYEPYIMANIQIWNVVLWLIILLFFCIICVGLCLYSSNYKLRSTDPDTCIEKA